MARATRAGPRPSRPWPGRSRRSSPQLQLRLAFLELMAPSLARGRAPNCAPPAARQVDVLPMFLGTGGHLRKDLPPMIERLREQHPSVRWRLHDAVGEQPLVREAMAAAALALLAEPMPRKGAGP